MLTRSNVYISRHIAHNGKIYSKTPNEEVGRKSILFSDCVACVMVVIYTDWFGPRGVAVRSPVARSAAICRELLCVCVSVVLTASL